MSPGKNLNFMNGGEFSYEKYAYELSNRQLEGYET